MVVRAGGGVLAGMSSRYRQGYAVVDVETSGLSPAVHRVLQIAVTQLAPDGSVESAWSTLVDPGCDPGPVHIHGLTRERLAGAPQFADIAQTIARLVRSRILVAHNAQFDWRFLSAEATRASVSLDVDSRLCTMALTRRLDLPVPNLRLESVAAYWGVTQIRAHDAVDDTRVLVDVLRHSLAAADRMGITLPLTRTSGAPEPSYPAPASRSRCPWRYAGRWTQPSRLVQGMTVVVTGATRLPRETLVARASAVGLDVMNSVSSRTSLVVCAEPGNATNKLLAARRHGTSVVGEDEFLLLLDDVAPGTEKESAPPESQSARARSTAPHSGAPSRGRLSGQRVLVVGGPHASAATLRERIAGLGGQVAVNLTASVTAMAVLEGAENDPRYLRGRHLGLTPLSAETLLPDADLDESAQPPARVGNDVQASVSEPSERSREALVLPRGGAADISGDGDWALSVRWSDNPGRAIDLDVVALVTDENEQVAHDHDLVFFNAPAHPSGAVEVNVDLVDETLVRVRPSSLPSQTRRVIVAAALPDGLTFGDVGPIEISLRDDEGACVIRATLDAATEEQTLILATIYFRGSSCRFRAEGQGYATGLAALASRHGVDVEEE